MGYETGICIYIYDNLGGANVKLNASIIHYGHQWQNNHCHFPIRPPMGILTILYFSIIATNGQINSPIFQDGCQWENKQAIILAICKMASKMDVSGKLKPTVHSTY